MFTRSRISRRRSLLAATALGAGVVIAAAVPVAQAAAPAQRFDQVSLVSDQPGVAQLQDPLLVNPWGLSRSPVSPVWASNNGTGSSTLYRGAAGGTAVSKVALEVAITGSAPTGQVFNDTTGFVVGTPPAGGPAAFIFDSETGDITGWNRAAAPTTALVMAHSDGAIYKGLALLHSATGPYLLAADFHHGRIDVFDRNWARVDLGSAFTDPQLPAGYAPFNVYVSGASVYVSYARQDAQAKDEIAGHNKGFVDKYTSDGRTVQRIASRGNLNAPWGMTIAPDSFGRFAGSLLVGNFGDGRIGAYTDSGDFLGFLRDAKNHKIAIDGLWALLPGTAASGGTDAVWFSAGPGNEGHGLLGLLRPSAR